MIWWVLIVGFNAGVIAYAVWLRCHERARVLLRRLALVCGALFVVSTIFGVALGLTAAFRTVGGESIDPSQKARILAEGISEAINWTAFGIVAFFVPALTSLILFLGARRRARQTPPG
jgi:hypothetical protein